ncbi:MAG: HAMP domain-containing histidine kinase [Ignavibacteria bacterium]|nr:HAMP domain-containing histidine kinase [Ignavibacteria bacterium]
MSFETYQSLILISILLNTINIVISILLLRDFEFKGGFFLIIVGLGIITLIQFYDLLTKEVLSTDVITISSFELVSFIGSIILFLILFIFLITRKVERKPIEREKFWYQEPSYNFYRPKEPTKKFDDVQNSKPVETKIQTPKTETKNFSPKQTQSIPLTEIKVKEETVVKEHVKEIPSNGKAVVAKFIKKEEPRSEVDKIKDELEKIKFQRDKLVSIISHDLRTPLTSVFGYCQLLKEGQYKNRSEVKKFAENIFELSQQQLNALNKIIEWTKYESPSLTLNSTEFDVTSTINFVAKTMSKIAERKNIKILVNSKPELYVYGDEFLIIEVLKNLLDNAIKFSHPNSSIEIHTHYHEKINKLVVLVVDSGVGIDREILMNLLVSTKKFTTRGTSGEKGLGLGLLIVKAIIDKHGEHFWIASEEGKWTRVYFTLKPANIAEG